MCKGYLQWQGIAVNQLQATTKPVNYLCTPFPSHNPNLSDSHSNHLFFKLQTAKNYFVPESSSSAALVQMAKPAFERHHAMHVNCTFTLSLATPLCFSGKGAN